MRESGGHGWHRVEFTLGVVDAALGLAVTVFVAALVMASGPSALGVIVVLLALGVHVQIVLFARRHSIHLRKLDLWGLVCAVVVQFGIALLGIVSYGILFVPALLLSVALLVVAFMRQSSVRKRPA